MPSKSMLTLLLLMGFVVFPKLSVAANCSEACAAAADCVTGNTTCRVCIGQCVSCGDLGDQTSCEDATTGASTYCVWTSGFCLEGLPVPEMPRPIFTLLWLLLPLGIILGFQGNLTYTRR